MFKKACSILVAVMMVISCILIPSVATATNPQILVNNFDGDLFNTYNYGAGQYAGDTIRLVNSPLGFTGAGKAINWARAGGGWSGWADCNLPALWIGNMADMSYVSFMARGNAPDMSITLTMRFKAGKTWGNTGSTIKAFSIPISGDQWQKITLPFTAGEITTANGLWFGYETNSVPSISSGTVYMDDFTLTNYDPNVAATEFEISDSAFGADKISVTATKNVEGNALLLIAAYNNQQLVGFKSFDIADLSGSQDYEFPVDFEYNDAKVFIWRGFNDITPMIDATVKPKGYLLTNSFDPDLLPPNAYDMRWTGSSSADEIHKITATGYNSANAIGFSFSRPADSGWSGTQTIQYVANVWDFSQVKYLSFWARGNNPDGESRNNIINLGLSGFTAEVNVLGDDWQYFVIPIKNGSGDFVDQSSLTRIDVTSALKGHTGVVIIDDLTFSAYDPS